MVYLSVSARLLVNLEALNMAESVGNVTKHKRAPIVVKISDDSYRVQLVPVVSGQSIAHGYQVLLAEEATRLNLPVCPLCKQGIFVKHASDEILSRLSKFNDYKDEAETLIELSKNLKPDTVHEFEEAVVKNCVVEDVGGFLYTGNVPVKRTSRFMSSYMIPARIFVEAAASDYLIHARHDPAARGEEAAQMIYYVESGSALYTLTLALDLDWVGVVNKNGKRVCLADRENRLRAALNALIRLLANFEFGAKKSRFLPHIEVESLAVALVHPLRFNVPAGHENTYIKDAVDLLASLKKAFNELEAELHYYIHPKSLAEKPEVGEEVTVKEHKNHVDALREAADKALNIAKSNSNCNEVSKSGEEKK